MRMARRSIPPAPAVTAAVVIWIVVGAMAGCGSGGSSGGGSQSQGQLTVALQTSSVMVAQDGTPTRIQIVINSTSETALVSFTGLPGGVQETYAASDTNPSGLLSFIASPTAVAGTFKPIVIVNSAGQTASQPFTMVVAPTIAVEPGIDTTLGVKGKLTQFMSTSFQIAEWTGDFFGTDAAVREATLTNVGPQHIRLQPLSQAIPMKANTGAASDWDFTLLDQTVQPVLASADHSPEFQIATAPAWMCDANGYLDVANHAGDFAAYAAKLVRYYNKGGFDVAGVHFQSPSTQAITWWGILNEPAFNGLTAAQYTKAYNAAVPAMLAIDPAIKIVALEFSGSTLGTGFPDDPQIWLPPFFAAANAGGVSAHIDVVAMHMYATCNQLDTDATLFDAVPQYVAVNKFIDQQLSTRADLTGTPVWVTENNVNADFANASGMSSCNPGQMFVADGRGTSAYFAAWRPYVFSQFAKAGNQALYQWDYSADKQYGEVDANGIPYLSYWVDRTLANYYSLKAAMTPDILSETSTDTSSIETLATRNGDGTVRIMIVNKAVHGAADDNGAGEPRTVVVDASSLGNFMAASLLTIDANTNLTNGPTGTGIAPAPRITITLNGYGVAFLSLMP
jgi:hypothetical protein